MQKQRCYSGYGFIGADETSFRNELRMQVVAHKATCYPKCADREHLADIVTVAFSD